MQLLSYSLAGGRPRAGVGFAVKQKQRPTLETNLKGPMRNADYYSLLPRLFPCAAIRVRDDTMEDQFAGYGHSRKNNTCTCPVVTNELVRHSGDRSGQTAILRPLPPSKRAHANKMPVVLEHGGAPRNRRRRRGRPRRKVLPVQPIALQPDFGTERQMRARRQWQDVWRGRNPTF